jgi:hypothetical protein
MRTIQGCVLGILVLLVGGWITPASAAQKCKFEYEKPEDRGAGGTAIAVTFENARPEEEGGDDPVEIGVVRSTVGIPWRLEAKKGDVTTLVPAYFSDVLRASGYDAHVGDGDGLPRLHVILEELWCFGHTHYEISIKARMQLFPAGATAPAWEQSVESMAGVTLVMSVAEMKEGYEEAFALALPKLTEMFGSEEFGKALSGPVAAEPEPVPAVDPATGTGRSGDPAGTETETAPGTETETETTEE